MRRRPVKCDRCGGAIDALAGALVRLRFDYRDVLVESGVDHPTCANSPPEAGARVEAIAAVEFMQSAGPASRLRCLARLHDGGSVSRVIQKIRRLAALETAPRQTTREAA